MASARWTYERGEHRYKHCWNENHAGFEPGHRGPIGKCPNTLRDEEAQALLESGIAFFKNEGDSYPSHIYNVHRGVIYEASPTNPGKSYHGYPWRGKRHQIPRRILDELEQRAIEGGDGREFDKWLKNYMQ